jgi:hypothetical protein
MWCTGRLVEGLVSGMGDLILTRMKAGTLFQSPAVSRNEGWK